MHPPSPTSTPNTSPSVSARQLRLRLASLSSRRCRTPRALSAPSSRRPRSSCASWARIRSSSSRCRLRSQNRLCCCPRPSLATRRASRHPSKLMTSPWRASHCRLQHWVKARVDRINENRTEEALRTLGATGGNGHDAIATGCPFCRIMLTDGLTAKQATGSAPETTEVLDVAQLLLEAVNRTQ